MQPGAVLSRELAIPRVASSVRVSPGDVVRLECESDGTWFYCHVEDCLADGTSLCCVVEAQCWPSLVLEGILPGVTYAVPPDRVLSIVKTA